MTSRIAKNRFSGRHFLLAAALLLLAAAQGGCYGSDKLLGMIVETMVKGGPKNQRTEDYEFKNVEESPLLPGTGRMYVYVHPVLGPEYDDQPFDLSFGAYFYGRDDDYIALRLDGRRVRAINTCLRCISGILSVDLAPGSHTLQLVSSSQIAISEFTIEIERGRSYFIRISHDDFDSQKLAFRLVSPAAGREEAAESFYAPVDFEELEPSGFIGIQSDVPRKIETESVPTVASDPPSVRQPPLRIALFPASKWDACGQPLEESNVARAIGRSLSSNSQLNLVFSPILNLRGQKEFPEDIIEEMRLYQLEYTSSPVPNVDYVFETGIKLDADAVLLIAYTGGCEQAKGDFSIWLIDLNVIKDYYVKFYTQNYSVSGLDELGSAMNGFLKVHLPLLSGKSGAM